jgi:hypothetical protein
LRTLVGPAISAWCGGGTIQQVEGIEKSILDMSAGIDAWQILQGDQAMRGYPYDTFSIRFLRRRNPSLRSPPGCTTITTPGRPSAGVP